MDRHAELIVRRLGQARRRCLWVLAARQGSHLLLYGSVGFALVAFVLRGTGAADPAAVDLRDLAAAAGLGLLASGVLAVLLARLWAPSREEMARGLDRRLGLEQRVETAVGLLAAGDGTSALLRRDAARRVERLDLRRLYPLQAGLRPWTLGLALSALVVVLLLLRWAPGPESARLPHGFDAGAGEAREAEPEGTTDTQTQHRAGDSKVSRRPGATSGLSSPVPGLVSQAPGGASAPDSPTAGADESTERLGTSTWHSGAPESNGRPGGGGAPVPASGTRSKPSAAARVPGSHAVVPRGRVHRGTAGGGAASARPSPALGRGSQGAAPVLQQAPGTPGGDGSEEPAAGTTLLEPRGDPRGEAAGRQHRDDEEAVAPGRFPPGLRRYVRDYFLSIHREPPP